MVALAGPASNIVLAFGASVLLSWVFDSRGTVGITSVDGFLTWVVQLNLLLAVFNLIPVPPLDGGNVLAGFVPESVARMIDHMRPWGFLILYAMLFTGVLWCDRRSGLQCVPEVAACDGETTGRVGHAADRPAAPRPPGRCAPELGGPAGAVRLLLLRGRLARADERLRGHRPDRRERARQRGRLDRRRASIPNDRPSSSSRSCPSTPSSTCCCRWSTPIPWLERVPTYKEQIEQLTDRDLSTHRLPRLSAAPDGRRHHLRRALRAGGRGPGAAPRALARGRAAVPQLLRRGLRRAAAAAHADAAPAGSRQPQDEQELRQHHRPVRRPGRRASRRSGRCTRTRSASGPTSPARSRATRCSSTTTRSTRHRAEVDDLKARYRAGTVGDVEVKTKLAAAINADARADPRAPRRGPRPAGRPARGPSRRLRPGPGAWPRDDGPRARGREAAILRPDSGSGDVHGRTAAARIRVDPRGLSGPAPNFEGPLDLLLHLIRKHEVEHLRHPDRAHHAAVPRLPRPDAGAGPRRGRASSS